MTTIDAQIPADVRNERLVSLRELATAAAGSFCTLFDMLLDWQERARQRRALLALDDRALQDFGASRADASAEGDKRFWRL